MGAMYMECSSKEMTGVHEIFDTAIDIAVRGQDELYAEEQQQKGKRGSKSAAGEEGMGGMMVPSKKKKRGTKCSIL